MKRKNLTFPQLVLLLYQVSIALCTECYACVRTPKSSSVIKQGRCLTKKIHHVRLIQQYSRATLCKSARRTLTSTNTRSEHFHASYRIVAVPPDVFFATVLWLLIHGAKLGRKTPNLKATPALKIALFVEPTPFNYISGYSNRFREMLK